jgi:hypothetical protein
MSTPSSLLRLAGVLCLGAIAGQAGEAVPLLDGKTLAGWKPSKNSPAGTYQVVDGVLQVRGGQGHLFYVGADGQATFRNFEFTAKVKTYKGANSGIYFHTAYQDGGWPAAGYECQVNATHGDKKKTGGLYAVKDVMDTPAAPDDEWFDYRIRVEGKRVQIWINGKQTVDFTEPADWTPPKGMAGRKLGAGTFALQAHDPGCKVDYKDIKVETLP